MPRSGPRGDIPRPRGGIPCYAYLAQEEAQPVKMSLIFKYNESPVQASLFLQSYLPVHGVELPQIITLQYDGDNVTHGVLGPAKLPLPQARLDYLTRKRHPRIQTLTLTLNKPCHVWHLPTPCTPLTAQRGHEPLFESMCGLAKATTLCIAFDYCSLQKDACRFFRQLYERPQELPPCLDRNFPDRFTRADWSVFDTRGKPPPAVHSNAATPEPELLPPYATAGSKRARPVSSGSTPTTPPSKRALPLPCPEYVPTSPTEPATPKAPYPLAVATPDPSSPTASVLNRNGALEKAVRAVLPGILEALLPSLVALPQPSLLASPEPAGSQPPSVPKLSSLGTHFGTWVTQQIATQVQSIHDQTIVNVESLYEDAAENAAAEIRDQVEESATDIRTTKEDALDELKCAADLQRQAFEEHANDYVNDCWNTLADNAAKVVDDATLQLGNLKAQKSEINQEMGRLGRKLDMLAREIRYLEHSQRALEPPVIDQRRQRQALSVSTRSTSTFQRPSGATLQKGSGVGVQNSVIVAAKTTCKAAKMPTATAAAGLAMLYWSAREGHHCSKHVEAPFPATACLTAKGFDASSPD
ncbi:hypothetical protein OPT61_g2421 [Boeremia exigua]|uniref:Uncharacterized protein n=1 Tax=Boeremia exigua TaxID=749465 RepID=A0ACC2ILL2_9PLEO|nr:hypothetical protein OPT61_g2421 [Boeremia exigua]